MGSGLAVPAGRLLRALILAVVVESCPSDLVVPDRMLVL